jgi:hypothetical protein
MFLSVTQTQALYQGLIAVEILIAQVLKQFAAFADHHQKTAAGMKVLLVYFHMFRELPDTRREDGHLNFRGAGIRSVRLVLFDYLRFQFFVYHFVHSRNHKSSHSGCRSPQRLGGPCER